ncbi:MAG: YifB family Mg chelatase-like AAA ATPase, partial [Anaerovoracaceae bacterium]
MLAKVYTAALSGLDGGIVSVEADIATGLVAFNIVGLPDTTIRESGERIRPAIFNTGYKFPTGRITVNLSPANLKKIGTHFDLPIAMGILSASGAISLSEEKIAFIGELSLDGKLNGINGALPLVISLSQNGFRKIVLPKSNVKEAALAEKVELFPVSNLSEAVEILGNIEFASAYKRTEELPVERNTGLDFADVVGQENVKRALEISAAGAHGMLMIGGPGVGKSMLAKRLPGILPELSYKEKLEVTKIYSIAGLLNEKKPMIVKRPFRNPHHTITSTAMVGGGFRPGPGEFSLAHNGVLFLDEVPQFDSRTLETLRQPIEEKEVTISRKGGNL